MSRPASWPESFPLMSRGAACASGWSGSRTRARGWAGGMTGAVVTLDALHTQAETARHLAGDKRAHYLMIIKGKPPRAAGDLPRPGHLAVTTL